MNSLLRSLSLASVAACALNAAGLAAGETRAGVHASTTAGATSNPYLTETDAGVAGVFDLDVRPWARIETARTTFDLQAYAHARAFSDRYDFEDSEGASVSFRSKRDARTSLYGSAHFDSTSARSVFPRTGSGSGVTDPVTPADPQALPTETTVLIPGDDITLLGLTGRTTSLATALGVDHQLDARSVVGASAGFQHLSASGGSTIGYDSLNATATYAAQVSEQTQIGARLSGRRTSYDAGGNSTILVGEGTVERRLDASWSLSASAGLTNARMSATAAFPSTTATGFSGRVQVCNERSARSLCASMERSQLPGALGRARRVDNAMMSFGERLSVRGRVDVAARYSRSRSLSGTSVFDPPLTVASVDANFTRTLSERMEGFAFASVARSYSPVLSTSPSVNAGAGIRLKLGQIR